jgi:hypothetical protein
MLTGRYNIFELNPATTLVAKKVRLTAEIGLGNCLAYFIDELAGVGKIAINARETYIGDFVNSPQVRHNAFADES